MPASIRLIIPVTPPGVLGTTKGGHIYVEAPDQSSTPAARMDGTTLMDGSTTMQGSWAPIDLGKQTYVAGEQPWVILSDLGLNGKVSTSIRVYVSSFSDDIDLPLVRYGLAGATPSYVVTVPAQASQKPNSGSNITPFLVTGITGAVSAAVSVGGKLRRPIGITVSLSGLPTGTPTDWAYQLLGFANGDLTTSPILASGLMTVDGLIPAGPDGISTPHTFAPEEPTVITSVTIYAVAGLIAGSRMPGARGTYQISTEFTANNIIPGITASCVVSIGTVTGVVDMRAAMLASTSAEFQIDPATGMFSMLAIDFSKAKPGTFTTEFVGGAGSPLSMGVLIADKMKTGVLEVGGADTGGTRVSRFKVFDTVTPTANLIGWIGDDSAGSGFIGAWFKRILIGGTSPATAKIVADAAGNVAISGTLIAGNIAGNAGNITGTLLVGQLGTGTLPVGVVYAGIVNCSQLTAGGITGITLTLNQSGVTTALSNTAGFFGRAGLRLSNNASAYGVSIEDFGVVVFNGSNQQAIQMITSGGNGTLQVLSPSGGATARINTDGAYQFGGTDGKTITFTLSGRMFQFSGGILTATL